MTRRFGSTVNAITAGSLKNSTRALNGGGEPSTDLASSNEGDSTDKGAGQGAPPEKNTGIKAARPKTRTQSPANPQDSQRSAEKSDGKQPANAEGGIRKLSKADWQNINTFINNAREYKSAKIGKGAVKLSDENHKFLEAAKFHTGVEMGQLVNNLLEMFQGFFYDDLSFIASLYAAQK